MPEEAERCSSCDAAVSPSRQVVTDETTLPEDVRREINDARRQLLIPRPVDRGPKTVLEDAGRALVIAAGGVLLAMVIAWIAFRVL